MKYEMIVENDANEAFATFLQAHLRIYNDARSVHHQEKRKPGAVQPLNIILYDVNHEWIGGLSAEILWNWLEIKDFWLREEYRNQGIGTTVLREAERIALSKGCEKAFLATFDFQGKSFYQHNGYDIIGALEGYPPGNTYYWMMKRLG